MSASVSLEEATPRSASLSDLLKLLLGIGADAPVAATPSFQSWLDTEDSTWPPRADVPSGLWLLDTRDAVGRRDLPALAMPVADGSRSFEAALILTGTGRPGSVLRRLLRRFRRRGTRRLPPDRALRQMVDPSSGVLLHRLGFDDGPDVPGEFFVHDSTATGTALLLLRRPMFEGAIWSLIKNSLNDATGVEIDSFQLRVRGAAVVMLRAGDLPLVIRIVPAGPLQDVIARNHQALLNLRRSLKIEDQLLARIPAPVFSERTGSAAVFGETRLTGTLAWKLASGTLATSVYRNTLEFLDTLRTATLQLVTLRAERLAELLEEDRSLLAASVFVPAAVRRALANELDAASAHLENTDLPLYTSHGDFGYGNVLVNDETGEIEGVIDWDTARLLDVPGIDRVNLEIQIRRRREPFATAVESVWQLQSAHDALHREAGPATLRALFGLAVCRYIIRAFRYPAVYGKEAAGFERALHWLSRTGP